MTYSDKFLAAFKFSVLGWEAVYSKGHYGDPNCVVTENVPGDPGGTTKWGIDQRDHPVVQVSSLSEDDAMRIFHDGVRDSQGRLEGGEWSLIRGDDLPDKWAIALFDCVINPGRVCIHWAQEILGQVSDGVIGPETVAAINGASDLKLNLLLCKRGIYYQTRGAWANKFKQGWLDRNAALRKQIGLTVA